MTEEEKKAVEYLKTRLYGNEGCKYIDVAQEDLRIFINLIDRREKEIESWKENEELKQERINNLRMIALAQNEMLGYIEGYEDGKNLRKSAVAIAIENQQYYIIKKQIEKYETYIKELQNENKKLRNQEATQRKINALLVQRYSSSVSLQKIKDKIEEITQKIKYEENEKVLIQLHKQRKVLQELIKKED